MSLKNINISTVLTVFVFISLTFTVLVGINGLLNTKRINSQLDSMYLDRVIVLQNLKTISDLVSSEIPELVNQFEHNQLTIQEANIEITEHLEQLNGLWVDYKKTKIVGKENVLSNQTEELLNKVYISIDNLKVQINNYNGNEADLDDYINDTYLSAIDPFIHKIDELTRIQLSISNDLYQNANMVNRRAGQSTIAIILIAFLLCGFLSYYVIIKIKKSFKEINGIIEKISDGNLSVEFPEERDDEIGRLLKSLSKMAQELNSVVSSVYESIDAITSASLELSSASQTISNGAASQALSAEKVSSSINQMKLSIHDNSESAGQAETISRYTNEHITELSTKSSESAEQIKLISDKITIIEEIAFQTNILSLNAAVEAARAGEYGKGFGVVAAEVGKLAERSKHASIEIDQLSKKSVKVASESKAILEGIVPKINHTSELVIGISEASTNQSNEAKHIYQAIDNLNNVVHQNAASAEELATSAEELSGQTEQLKEVFKFFKTSKTHLPETERPVKAKAFKNTVKPVLPSTNKNRLEIKKSKEIIDIKLDDNDELDEEFERF